MPSRPAARHSVAARYGFIDESALRYSQRPPPIGTRSELERLLVPNELKTGAHE